MELDRGILWSLRHGDSCTVGLRLAGLLPSLRSLIWLIDLGPGALLILCLGGEESCIASSPELLIESSSASLSVILLHGLFALAALVDIACWAPT